MVALGDMAGQTQVSFTLHGGVIDSFGDMTSSRTTSSQIQMHFLGMRGVRRL